MFLSDDNIANYYETNFTLMQYYHWSLHDVEDMFPFERMIYVAMVSQYQTKQQQQQQQALQQQRR